MSFFFSLWLLYSFLLSASLSPVVNCTEPGHVENSIRQVLPSGPHRYSFQTTVSYRCNPGYYLLGTSSISCQGDGTWDRSLPKCLCEYLRARIVVVTHHFTRRKKLMKTQIIWAFMLNIIFVTMNQSFF